MSEIWGYLNPVISSEQTRSSQPPRHPWAFYSWTSAFGTTSVDQQMGCQGLGKRPVFLRQSWCNWLGHQEHVKKMDIWDDWDMKLRYFFGNHTWQLEKNCRKHSFLLGTWRINVFLTTSQVNMGDLGNSFAAILGHKIIGFPMDPLSKRDKPRNRFTFRVLGILIRPWIPAWKMRTKMGPMEQEFLHHFTYWC